MSNVATTINVGFDLEIDAGMYFEAQGGTLSLFPNSFSIDKLYAKGSATALDAAQLTIEAELTALEVGYNLAVHAGHGATSLLTVEMYGDNAVTGGMTYGLTNTDYPILLSCACEAGAFDVSDSAGEDLVNAPAGGAIGYLGNTAVGLGLAGGSQLIDEFLIFALSTTDALVGDALTVNLAIPKDPEAIVVGLTSEGHLPALVEASF